MGSAFLARLLVPAALLAVAAFLWPGGRASAPPAVANTADYSLIAPAISREAFPEVTVSAASAFQGGAVRVSASNAVNGSLTVFGRTSLLSPASPGADVVSGFVGLDTDDPPGVATLTIIVVDRWGEIHHFERPLLVKATSWTVDYIILPPPPEPDPGAPPPPPAPDDNAILPGVYASVTTRQWTDSWLLPLAEPSLRGCGVVTSFEVACVSGYFGEQRSFNGGPVSGYHTGTDLAAASGTPIRATNHGTVTLSGLYRVRGNLVVIDHGGGVMSSYGHMSSIAVSAGDVVRQGDIIGYVGSTGLSTGPHLHWELVVSGVRVDALRWLDGTQGF